MLVNKIILAPAKINIFLKVLSKRNDGYHEIRSGITFVNLFDKIEITGHYENRITYSGKFKPNDETYDNCIIQRTIDFLELREKLNMKINVQKNIPVQGGLGSASTNAASLIIFFESIGLIEKKNPSYYASLGADIPCFLFKKDCIATGMGENLIAQPFPKYFFLLVKPKFNNSTKRMYQKLKFNNKDFNYNYLTEKNQLNEDDNGNDFDQIVVNENFEYQRIIEYLENLDQAIFARMTGSGSCCYAVFEKKEYVLNAIGLFKSKFPDLWSIVCENNIIKI